MVITKEFISEMESLPEEHSETVRQFVYFLKYRNLITQDDTQYLSSIPKMLDSIKEGINTPLSECKNLEAVWFDV
ncbi:MAG: hypothetical protein LBH98_09965 [Chitinispirillales bacterium]|nr:hypothetical protein [Chitinispirillales bacterium]